MKHKLTLGQRVQEWETRNGFKARTLASVAKGARVKPSTAFHIARALGFSEEEAKEYAREASPEPIEQTKKSA